MRTVKRTAGRFCVSIQSGTRTAAWRWIWSVWEEDCAAVVDVIGGAEEWVEGDEVVQGGGVAHFHLGFG